MSLAIRDARVVVGLDFGTTFSGFAYAHKSCPNDVYKFYEWPDSTKGGGRPYCKTETSLYYVAGADANSYELKGWGWTALVAHREATQEATRARRLSELGLDNTVSRIDHIGGPAADEVGLYFTKFKLHLAGEGNISSSVVGPLTAGALPAGFSADRLITDYLAKIAAFTMEQLQKQYGDQLTAREVQWCLTVPAIWDDKAKQKMKDCAQKAGLVSGPYTPTDVVASPHPLLIILEPEAASMYCWTTSKDLELKLNDQILIADIGGGTVDIVVHAKASEDPGQPKLKEVKASSGGLCGGTYVDRNFFEFLCSRIGCFRNWVLENHSLLLNLQGRWQNIKSTFDGRQGVVHDLDLPSRLAREWEKHDKLNKLEPKSMGYEELCLSTADMKEIFDPIVNEIIRLIEHSMTAHVKVMMVVGGFSASPYLMSRIVDRFATRVQKIINPPEPGCAICHGAVLMGIASTRCIISRISRKTYGTNVTRVFLPGTDPMDKRLSVDGIDRCADVFLMYVQKGTEVKIDHCESHTFSPVYLGQRSVTIRIFSCRADATPHYVTDEGVVCEGTFNMDITDGLELDRERRVRVSMYFGRSTIEVRAQRENFGNRELVESLHMHFDHDV